MTSYRKCCSSCSEKHIFKMQLVMFSKFLGRPKAKMSLPLQWEALVWKAVEDKSETHLASICENVALTAAGSIFSTNPWRVLGRSYWNMLLLLQREFMFLRGATTAGLFLAIRAEGYEGVGGEVNIFYVKEKRFTF